MNDAHSCGPNEPDEPDEPDGRMRVIAEYSSRPKTKACSSGKIDQRSLPSRDALTAGAANAHRALLLSESSSSTAPPPSRPFKELGAGRES